MNKDLVREALEIGLNYVLESGWTRHRDEEISIIEKAILELDKPKPYYPLGQEPVHTNCFTCKKYYSCDLPMDCQGRQWEANNL